MGKDAKYKVVGLQSAGTKFDAAACAHMRSFFSMSEWMSIGWAISEAGTGPQGQWKKTGRESGERTWCHEVYALQRLVAAHEDVEMEVGLGKNGHVRVLGHAGVWGLGS